MFKASINQTCFINNQIGYFWTDKSSKASGSFEFAMDGAYPFCPDMRTFKKH